MADIIKTLPSHMDPRAVAEMFSAWGAFTTYYFAIGRGKGVK